MDFELSDEQKDVQKAAREFAQGEFDPDLALDLDQSGAFELRRRRIRGPESDSDRAVQESPVDVRGERRECELVVRLGEQLPVRAEQEPAPRRVRSEGAGDGVGRTDDAQAGLRFVETLLREAAVEHERQTRVDRDLNGAVDRSGVEHHEGERLQAGRRCRALRSRIRAAGAATVREHCCNEHAPPRALSMILHPPRVPGPPRDRQSHRLVGGSR